MLGTANTKKNSSKKKNMAGTLKVPTTHRGPRDLTLSPTPSQVLDTEGLRDRGLQSAPPHFSAFEAALGTALVLHWLLYNME